MSAMKDARVRFGQFLMNRRIEMGLTQIEVARHLNYGSAQFVSNWERGVCWPPKDQYQKLAWIFELDLGHFIDVYVDTRAVELYNAFGIKPKPRRHR